MELEIRGHNFPGKAHSHDGESRDNVHVGVQIGRDAADLAPGDADGAGWVVTIEVIERDGEMDFRGPAVQGRRGERFVYLTWGDVDDDGMFAMFRRAKLMLADVEPLVRDGGPHERIVATVDLTDECGGPRCARLRPPALTLAAGPPSSGPARSG